MKDFYQIDLSREACVVEEEYTRVKRIMSQARSIFMVDFRYEQKYKQGDQPAPVAPKPSEIEAAKEDEPAELKLEGTFKKLRNQLAKMFHPDKESEDPEVSNKFKEIQEAFEEGNFSKLINTAVENDVDVKLSVSDSIAIENLIRDQRNYIKEQMQTAEWFWYYSDRKSSDRARVWEAMNIQLEKFVKWLNSKKISLAVLEAESISRKKIEKIIPNEPTVRPPQPRRADPTEEIKLITS